MTAKDEPKAEEPEATEPEEEEKPKKAKAEKGDPTDPATAEHAVLHGTVQGGW